MTQNESPAEANFELADMAPADGQLSLEEIKQHHRGTSTPRP